MTGWSISRLPNTIRWFAHFKDSSTMHLLLRMTLPVLSLGFGSEGPTLPETLTGHGPALMVEIAQDDMDTLVFLPEQILDGYFDIVKGDVGGTCCRRVRGLDGRRLDAFLSFDQEHTKPLSGSHASDKVV
jgi:hypothetical protein